MNSFPAASYPGSLEQFEFREVLSSLWKKSYLNFVNFSKNCWFYPKFSKYYAQDCLEFYFRPFFSLRGVLVGESYLKMLTLGSFLASECDFSSKLCFFCKNFAFSRFCKTCFYENVKIWRQNCDDVILLRQNVGKLNFLDCSWAKFEFSLLVFAENAKNYF